MHWNLVNGTELQQWHKGRKKIVNLQSKKWNRGLPAKFVKCVSVTSLNVTDLSQAANLRNVWAENAPKSLLWHLPVMRHYAQRSFVSPNHVGEIRDVNEEGDAPWQLPVKRVVNDRTRQKQASLDLMSWLSDYFLWAHTHQRTLAQMWINPSGAAVTLSHSSWFFCFLLWTKFIIVKISFFTKKLGLFY